MKNTQNHLPQKLKLKSAGEYTNPSHISEDRSQIYYNIFGFYPYSLPLSLLEDTFNVLSLTPSHHQRIFIQIFMYNTFIVLSNMRQQQSLKQILPMIQRVCQRKKETNYSHGNTYKDNGLVLKHLLTTVKIKNIVSVFARKLKRNITSSQPANFKINEKNRYNQQRTFNCKGWDVEDRLEGIILLLDIIMTLFYLFVSTFQGLLDDFRLHDSTSTIVVALKCTMLVIFISRILMAFVTITFQDGKMYQYVTDIVLKLLKEGTIFIHIFNLAMVSISLAYPSDPTIGIISFFSALLKLFLVRSNLKILEFLYINSRRKFYIWNLAKIIIFNIIFGHLVSTCLLGISKIDNENNWVALKLYNDGLLSDNQPWYQIYFWSYYWACTIMITVGFGDITPVNYKEAIVVGLIEIFSSVVLAYNISEVGSIVSSIRKNSEVLERKLGILRRMMANNPVPQDLQLRIESYLTHEVQIEDKFQYDQHNRIITGLPQQLKSEYLSQSNKILYSSVPILKYFQKTTHTKLNQSFRGKVFYQGESIIQAKSGNDNVIIMRSGKISLKYWKKGSDINGSIIQTITVKEEKLKGLLISTNIFSHNSPINYDVLAENYSFGMILQREKFIQVLKENNLDYYFYRSILDKHQKEENVYEYVLCQYCKNQYHNKFQCPKLHYSPLRSLVIMKKIREKQPNCKVNIENIQRVQKPYSSHPYLTRKNIFTYLELELSMTKLEQIDQNLQVDEPHDFPMYFRQSNPYALKGVSFNARPLSQKVASKRLKTKRTILGEINSF